MVARLFVEQLDRDRYPLSHFWRVSDRCRKGFAKPLAVTGRISIILLSALNAYVTQW